MPRAVQLLEPPLHRTLECCLARSDLGTHLKAPGSTLSVGEVSAHPRAISIAKLAFEYFYFWHAPDRRGQVFSYVGTILQLGYGTDATNDGARTPKSVGFSPPRREPFSTQGDLLRSGSGPLARSPTTPARSHDDDRGLQGSSPFSPKLTILGSAALATSVIESTPFMV